MRGKEQSYLLTTLLRDVSRTFYLTLRVLPRPLRIPISLAYLLARAADTIADTRLLPASERLHYLQAFREQVTGPVSVKVFQEIESRLTDKQAIPAERRLLQSLPSLFAMLEGLAAVDRTSVQKVVITLTQGMEIDLTTFPAEDSGQIGVLKDEEALERYIYYVAGCVGEFWTTLLVTHTPALKHWQVPQMSAIGVRFGKALQLTNVLRDVPRDLRIGRCYLPERDLARLGVTPEALLDPASGIHIRPLLFQYIRKTLDYYRAAEGYLLAIPRRCLRLRLAVLWPILIGLGTLHVLGKNEAWLDPSQPSKVGRRWVYRILLLSLPVVWSDRLLRTWIGHWRRRVEAVLTEK